MSDLDLNLDNVDDIKDIPLGWYAGVIADTKLDKSKSEDPKPFARFAFRAQQALDDQDLTGVELNRMIYSTDQWLSPKAAPIFKKRMTESGFEPAGNISEWLKSLHLRPVHFRVGIEERTTKSGEKRQNVRVLEFKAA
jgi:hypothetical protein